LIFDRYYNGKITAKAIDPNGLEFGRASVNITAEANDGRINPGRKDLANVQIRKFANVQMKMS